MAPALRVTRGGVEVCISIQDAADGVVLREPVVVAGAEEGDEAAQRATHDARPAVSSSWSRRTASEARAVAASGG